MVAGSETKREKVVLMTYAYHVPRGYSLDSNRDLQADYALGYGGFALWGKTGVRDESDRPTQ
jgi:hypothetical protein